MADRIVSAVLVLRTLVFLSATAACLWGAATGQPLLGPAVVAVVFVAHLWTLPAPARQLRPLLLATIVGTGLETAWIAWGAYVPAGDIRGTPVCPLWVTSLWLNAVVFWQGVAAGRVSRAGAAAAGAVVAPLAYLLADRVHAIVVVWSPVAFVAAFAAYGAIALAAIAVVVRPVSPTAEESCPLEKSS